MSQWLFNSCRDRSVCGHSVTTRETLDVCSAEVGGATAYKVSGSFTHFHTEHWRNTCIGPIHLI